MTNLDRFLEVVGVVAIVLAIYYRKELWWTWKNRETLGAISDVAGAIDQLQGAK